MLLLLIRHAVTAGTGRVLTGWAPGTDLSSDGRAQAETLAEHLRPVRIDAIYSSPLERAVQTAEPMAKQKRLRVRQREEIGEVRYGDIQGKSLKVLARGRLWSQLRAWPSDVRFPGGETLRETQARAIGEIERIRASHPGQVVAVFSHADWIRLSLAHYMGVHIDLYRRLSIDPAAVSALLFLDHGVVVRMVNGVGSFGNLGLPERKR